MGLVGGGERRNRRVVCRAGSWPKYFSNQPDSGRKEAVDAGRTCLFHLAGDGLMDGQNAGPAVPGTAGQALLGRASAAAACLLCQGIQPTAAREEVPLTGH